MTTCSAWLWQAWLCEATSQAPAYCPDSAPDSHANAVGYFLACTPIQANVQEFSICNHGPHTFNQDESGLRVLCRLFDGGLPAAGFDWLDMRGLMCTPYH